jgi:hypothetical protein
MNELFFSGKHKQHVVKYIVCVSITTGLICYVSKAYPGSVHDKKCFDMCGVAELLADGIVSAARRGVDYFRVRMVQLLSSVTLWRR